MTGGKSEDARAQQTTRSVRQHPASCAPRAALLCLCARLVDRPDVELHARHLLVVLGKVGEVRPRALLHQLPVDAHLPEARAVVREPPEQAPLALLEGRPQERHVDVHGRAPVLLVAQLVRPHVVVRQEHVPHLRVAVKTPHGQLRPVHVRRLRVVVQPDHRLERELRVELRRDAQVVDHPLEGEDVDVRVEREEEVHGAGVDEDRGAHVGAVEGAEVGRGLLEGELAPGGDPGHERVDRDRVGEALRGRAVVVDVAHADAQRGGQRQEE